MPYADPEKKKAKMKEWRERNMAQGYGKWLYGRRKLLFDDAKRFRVALETIETMAGAGGAGEVPAMPLATIARDALAESLRAEQALGLWEGDSE